MCPGSVRLSQLFPEVGSSPAAIEGTEAHSYAEKWLTAGEPPEEMPDYMAEPLALYIAAVLSVTERPAVEVRLEIPAIHAACFGTADAMHRAENRVHVIDLKFGRMPVEVDGNWQLICYAAGACKPGDIVTVTIVQPRIFHPAGRVRSVVYTYDQLQVFVGALARSAALAMSDNPHTIPGLHCQYCPALHACPSARRSALFHIADSNPVEIPPDALSEELAAARISSDIAKWRVEALEKQTMELLKLGTRVPGSEIKAGAGRLYWSVSEDDIRAMSRIYDVEPVRLVTPVQALEMGIPGDVIEHYATRRPGRLQISTDSDQKAARIFKNEQ